MKNVSEKKCDLDRYIETRKKSSPAFQKAWEDEERSWKLGQELARAREKAGLSQEALAGRIGSTRSAVCRYERHPTNLRIGTLNKIASALGKRLVVRLGN